MKKRCIPNSKKKSVFSLTASLPKIGFSSSIAKTSPNINLQKTITNKNIPKIINPNIKVLLKTNKALSKRYKPNKTIEIIHKLNLESNIKETFLEEIKKEQKREKINSNREIKERRLGLLKKEDLDAEEEKNKEISIKNIREISIEKLNSKEKEKEIEKNYKQNIKDSIELEKKISELHKKIIELTDLIEGRKLEINVMNTYGKKIDKKNIASERAIARSLKRKNSFELKDKPPEKKKFIRRASVFKKDDFETEAKLIVKKHQRDEKGKQIKIEVDALIKDLEKLLKENQDLKEKLTEKKNTIHDLKNKLIDLYHTTLFEGLDFRGEGLARIILNIWNLGINVDMNFIPTYLDRDSTEFLFKKARQIIDMTKIRELIEEKEKDFKENLKKWKKRNNLSIGSNKNLKNYFFKTKIFEDEDNSLSGDYPISTLFMNNYKKENEIEFEKNVPTKINYDNLKSWNIPKLIIEKNKNLEDSKYMEQSLKNKIEMEDKKEVNRICKEFLFNGYEKKYNVCIETVIGALFGEINKDDMLNYYYKIKKENQDNLKKIEFYYPLTERKKK